LGTAAAAATPASGSAACRSRNPQIAASPTRPRGSEQIGLTAAETGSNSSTGDGGGGVSGSRRQLLPALAPPGFTARPLTLPVKSPSPSSPSWLPRTVMATTDIQLACVLTSPAVVGSSPGGSPPPPFLLACMLQVIDSRMKQARHGSQIPYVLLQRQDLLLDISNLLLGFRNLRLDVVDIGVPSLHALQ
ncbi:hypothetical protein Vretifemale_19439, partial [Volvox reticuliferus]